MTHRARRSLRPSLAAIAGAALLASAAAGLAASVGAVRADEIDDPTDHPAGFARIVARVKPAVIGIRVRAEEGARASAEELPSDSPLHQFFSQPPDMTPRPTFRAAIGSGFFISSDGYAVTNNHVVESGKDIEVTTDDGAIHSAMLIGVDDKTDIALIKVDGDNFPFVKFSDAQPQIGDWVLAIGNPFGFGGTVTAGIVSGRGRRIDPESFDDFIQIDAPVNKGNSGGPTFDLNGEVIGINTAIFSSSGGFIGIAFDIGAEDAKPVVQQLKDKGFVSRGWIGVKTQSVSPDIAESLGFVRPAGVLVSEPLAGSPAEKAGLEAGDVIISLNGNDVVDSRDLARQVGARGPGQSVSLGVIRKGERSSVEVTLGTMPRAPAAAPAVRQSKAPAGRPNLGLALTPARRVPGAGEQGVVVTHIDPDGEAAAAGIAAGDIIVDINGKAVSTEADVREALHDARARRSVLIRMKSHGQTRFVAVRTG